MTILQSANQAIDRVRKETDTVLLFCSLGKDSIVTLDLIYPKFKNIICVFMYFVPNLEHIERWVRWVKAKYPNITFVQVPHWNLSYILRAGVYCVAQPKIKLIKLRDVVDAMRLRYNVRYAFLGMKKADSMNRRLMLNGYAENGYENNGLVYPLAEWKQKDILAYMKQRRLPEPVRYSLKASSGVGFNIDCMKWLQENFPQDLQKIYKVFPLSERILWEESRKQPESML